MAQWQAQAKSREPAAAASTRIIDIAAGLLDCTEFSGPSVTLAVDALRDMR